MLETLVVLPAEGQALIRLVATERHHCTTPFFALTPVLRHTFAKTLLDSGVSLDKVAALLGHSDLNTTRRYTTPSADDLAQAVEGVG